MYFEISTYHPDFELNENLPFHFYILSRGHNSGRPERKPRPNCWVFQSNRQTDFEVLSIIFYSKILTPFLRGSVIEFIPLAEYKSIITPILEKAILKNGNINAKYLQLQKIDDLLEVFEKKKILMSQMKQAICIKEISNLK